MIPQPKQTTQRQLYLRAKFDDSGCLHLGEILSRAPAMSDLKVTAYHDPHGRTVLFALRFIADALDHAKVTSWAQTTAMQLLDRTHWSAERRQGFEAECRPFLCSKQSTDVQLTIARLGAQLERRSCNVSSPTPARARARTRFGRGTGSSPVVECPTESPNVENALVAYLTGLLDRQQNLDAVPEPIDLTPSMRIETRAYRRADSEGDMTLCGLGPVRH